MLEQIYPKKLGNPVDSLKSEQVSAIAKTHYIGKNMPVPDFKEDAKELTDLVSNGDEQAFGRLFERYRSRVYSIAFYLSKSPFAAEDISQEVFVSIWVSRKHLIKVESFDAYLYIIIYNKVLQYLKKESNQQQIVLWAVDEKSTMINTTEESLAAKEINLLLVQAIDQLPPQKKLIYQLSKENGMNYEQIGKQLQISPNTVKNHLVEAVKLIRRYFTHFTLQTLVITLFKNFF